MAKKENTRKYLLHELAHAYLRLALKTNNNRITGALYQSDGYYFNDYFDNKYMVSVSRNNIYNVLAESLDEIENSHRFSKNFAVYSDMSTLPGYNYYKSNNRQNTMLDSFNIYGLINLYVFYKELLSNYHERRLQIEDSVDNACNSLVNMALIPINPKKITIIDSMSASRATTLINKSAKIDQVLEKKKAELYLSLYFYNKTDNKAIFGNLNHTYEKFLDINELTSKQTEKLYELNPDLENMTPAQLNYVITCNVDNISNQEVLNTPSLFDFNCGIQIDKKGDKINIVDLHFDTKQLHYVGYKESLIPLYPTYMYSNPNTDNQEPLYLNENGEYCHYNGKVYEGTFYEIDKNNNTFIPRGVSIRKESTNELEEVVENQNFEIIDEEEPSILVDQQEFPVQYKGGKYYYQNGEICKSAIFEKRGDDISPYDDQVYENKNNSNKVDIEDDYYFGREK